MKSKVMGRDFFTTTSSLPVFPGSSLEGKPEANCMFSILDRSPSLRTQVLLRHQHEPAFQGNPTFSTPKESLTFSTNCGSSFEGLVHLAVALSDTELSPPLIPE